MRQWVAILRLNEAMGCILRWSWLFVVGEGSRIMQGHSRTLKDARTKIEDKGGWRKEQAILFF